MSISLIVVVSPSLLSLSSTSLHYSNTSPLVYLMISCCAPPCASCDTPTTHHNGNIHSPSSIFLSVPSLVSHLSSLFCLRPSRPCCFLPLPTSFITSVPYYLLVYTPLFSSLLLSSPALPSPYSSPYPLSLLSLLSFLSPLPSPPLLSPPLPSSPLPSSPLPSPPLPSPPLPPHPC